MRVICLLPLLLFSLFNSFAQNGVGKWSDHSPFSHAIKTVEANNKIFCLTTGGLFYYNKSDNAVSKLTRIEGLSDIEITSIAFNTQGNQLLIGYRNGNIDILENNNISNMPDIKSKTNLGNKTINNIAIIDNMAYCSCGFGIVVINLEKKEVKDTYLIGDAGMEMQVYDITADNVYLYAATENGIKKAEKSSPNLVNFAQWEVITEVAGYASRFSAVEYFNNRVFAIQAGETPNTDHVYYLENGSWSEMNTGYPANSYNSLENNYEHLLISSYFHADAFDHSLQNTMHLYTGSPRDAILDKNNNLWIADYQSGLMRNTENGILTSFYPTGPVSNAAFTLFAKASKVFVAAGAVTASWSNAYYSAEYNVFDGQTWTNMRADSAYDILAVVADPSNIDHIFAASWGGGILEFKNNAIVQRYNVYNSTLQSITSGDNNVRCAGLVFDASGNLWVTNSGVPQPISVRTPGGEWKSMPYGSIINPSGIGKLIITRNNHKWALLPRGYGLFAFDDNGTLDNANDDKAKRFGIADNTGNTISNYVFSIAEDLDGNIWVGTSSGPVVFYSPGQVFDEDIYAEQITIPRNDGSGLGDLLLSTETITAIAIDGANQKWFGTLNSGIFLMSEDAKQEIYHFTVDNSPLVSNTINDIAIAEKTGEVFIATNLGMMSFRSPATPGNENFKHVYVYPNPVRPDYTGDIIITGLIRDSNIKITDIAGNLVYETTSLGGQALWNGKNMDGVRASTGVYLVFCTNEDGSQSTVTKLLFIH
jgi:ligand-binding sensor domain-containing protein